MPFAAIASLTRAISPGLLAHSMMNPFMGTSSGRWLGREAHTRRGRVSPHSVLPR
jgi:hypothetical protein